MLLAELADKVRRLSRDELRELVRRVPGLQEAIKVEEQRHLAEAQVDYQVEANEPANARELAQELYGGEVYEYYPLGEYIVAAPGVCNGRPTFKYTRIEAAGALNLIAAGYSIEQIAQRFEVPQQAIEEAIRRNHRSAVSLSPCLRCNGGRIVNYPSTGSGQA